MLDYVTLSLLLPVEPLILTVFAEGQYGALRRVFEIISIIIISVALNM